MAPFPLGDACGATQVGIQHLPFFGISWLALGEQWLHYGAEHTQTRNWQLNSQKNRGKQSGNEQTWEEKTGKEQRESCNQKSSEANWEGTKREL